MIEIKLDLIGNELKDGTEQTKRFRQFIGQDKWTSEQIKKWLDECIDKNSGAHDQDLIFSLRKRLGFEVHYEIRQSRTLYDYNMLSEILPTRFLNILKSDLPNDIFVNIKGTNHER